ncbi:MAG: cupredoxin domain-containing protein [Bdellovibrionota bacterium]
MDRISKTQKAWAISVIVFFAIFLIPALAEAKTILAPLPPPKRTAEAQEVYPESRFGYEPEKQVNSANSGLASQAVQEMEEQDYQTGAARRPAGLMFGTDAFAAQPPLKPKVSTADEKNHTPRKVEEDGAPPLERATRRVESDSSSEGTVPSVAPGTITRRGVQEVALIAGDLGYFPRTVFVSRDVPVRLYVTGASKNTLCIMMDSFQVRKQVRSQKIEEITFTPTTPGKYRFYCPVNGMEGTMVVKEFSTNSATGPATTQE